MSGEYESWHHWKAAMLNNLFREQGVLRTAGRITPETIAEGAGAVGICAAERSRGFVRDSRFGDGLVIKGTNRSASRKWRKLDAQK